jgi:hypothetical protein
MRYPIPQERLYLGNPEIVENREKAVAICAKSSARYQWLNVETCVRREGAAGRKFPAIRGPADVPKVLLDLYPDLAGAQELFVLLLVDSANQPIGAVDIAKGSLSATTVGPADIFRPVLMVPARAFFIAHNHPSGKTDPSPDDFDLTRTISQGAKLLGVRLLDHFVVTHDPKTWVSILTLRPDLF